MITTPASPIPKLASKQTNYTIRFLVGRERVDDAYRAYALSGMAQGRWRHAEW